MPARVAAIVSKRLRPPVAAFLCLAAAQLLLLPLANCEGHQLPMGAVRVSLVR